MGGISLFIWETPTEPLTAGGGQSKMAVCESGIAASLSTESVGLFLVFSGLQSCEKLPHPCKVYGVFLYQFE